MEVVDDIVSLQLYYIIMSSTLTLSISILITGRGFIRSRGFISSST